MSRLLYHGSNTGGIKVLEPRISLECKRRVYATSDLAYALVRAGKQLDLIREEYHGPCEKFELAECYPGAFKQMFDCEGYVYMVEDDYFRINPDDADEYISDQAVPVHNGGEVYIPNIWYVIGLLEDRFKLIYYEDSEEYWRHVRGGLSGFIERKKMRKQKALALE